MSDLNVTVSLLLENQSEIARELERAGGIAGKDFGNGLTGETKKSFDALIAAADKAAKEVGFRFNKQKLQFETVKGEIIPQDVISKIQKLNPAFAEASRAVDIFRSSLSTLEGSSRQTFNILEAGITGVALSITNNLTNALLGGLGGVKGFLTGFMELDGELRLAAAAAGETGGYERLGDIVKKVGIEAAGTTKEVAALATSLVRAGFSVSEVEAALPGVVRGAEATGTSFEQFGDIVGNTLRGFGLDVEETARVVDVLVNTANSSNASIGGLGYTFEYTAPIAKALGVSLEDVAAATGLLANAGIQGSAAGTGLREALTKLQQAAGGASPEILGLSQGQERLQAVMKKLGVAVLDAQGKLLPLDQVFIKLKGSLQQLSQGDQVQIANILFGDQAGNKVLAILNQTDSAITKMFGDIKNSAGATEVARNSMAGFGLELRQLQGTLEEIGTSIGSVAAAGLRPLLSAANATVGAISGLPQPIKEAAGALTIVAAAAAAASVGIGALNVAVGTLGGWGLLRKEILSVASVLTGPIAASGVIVVALGVAAGLATGQFKNMDSATKQFVSTVLALGAATAVLRGQLLLTGVVVGIQKVIEAYKLWRTATNQVAAAQAVLTALTGPAGIARVALAIGAGLGTYAFLNSQIKETGSETKALSDKTKTLKDEIVDLQSKIEQGKKLKIDTSEMEKILADKQLELQQLENPLEIKLKIDKAENEIKSLQEKLSKLGNNDSKAGGIQVQLESAQKMKAVFEAMKAGTGSQAFSKLDSDAKTFVKTLGLIQEDIQKLRSLQVTLKTKAERDKVEKDIQQLQALAQKTELKFKAKVDIGLIDQQLAKLKAELDKTRKSTITINTVYGVPVKPSNDALSKFNNEKKEKERAIVAQIFDLESKKVAVLNSQVKATENQSKAAQKQVLTAQQVLELAKSKLSNEQQGIELASRLISLDKERLSSVQQIVDAYSNLARAQNDLTQSKFDLQGAQNDRQLNIAERQAQALNNQVQGAEKVIEVYQRLKTAQEDLKALEDSGASSADIEVANQRVAAARDELGIMRQMNPEAGKIIDAQQRIADLKKQGEEIEKAALAAAIEGAAKRFEIERKILELKQAAQLIEQQNAVRTSERGVLEDRKQLLDLQAQLKDPKLAPEQKAAIAEQIQLQQQSLALSQGQVAADKERLGSLQTIFGLERQALEAKQQTESNQLRSTAVAKGWEQDLQGLQKLDKQAGITYRTIKELVGEIQIPGQPVEKIYRDVVVMENATKKSSLAWGDVNKEANKVLDTINSHNKAIDSGNKKLGELANKEMPNQKAVADESKKTADTMVENFASASERIKEGLTQLFEDMIEKEKQYRKTAFTSIVTPNFVYMEPPKPEDMQRPSGYTDDGWLEKLREIRRGGSPWYSPEDLAGIQKLEKATGMAADQFFDASEKATYLERTLSAIGKEGDNLEKVKWFEKALAEAGQPGNLEDAQRLANKQNLQFPNPLAGGGFEAELDKIAAGLADADARAKGLTGSIEGLRDNLGRPVDATAWNLPEIQKNLLEESKRALSPDAIREALQSKDFSLKDSAIEIPVSAETEQAKKALSELRDSASSGRERLSLGEVDTSGIDTLKMSLTDASNLAIAFQDNSLGISGNIQNEFLNAANSIVPFNTELDGLKQNLSSLDVGSINNPFDQWDASLTQTQNSITEIGTSIDQAAVGANTFETALPDPSQSDALRQAYDSLAPSVNQAAGSQTVLNDGTAAGIGTTQQLGAEWDNVNSKILAAVESAKQLAAVPGIAARWAGGDAIPGRSYQVNELGSEAFLGRSGALTMINAPAYGRWTPREAGVVIPAGITAKLAAAGLFENGRINMNYHLPSLQGNKLEATFGNSMRPTLSRGRETESRSASIMAKAMAQLTKAMGRLTKSNQELIGKTWTVNVPRASSGIEHLRTMQSFL